jgi:hypothetical protein
LEIWPQESPHSAIDCSLLALLLILDSGYPKAKLHGLDAPSTDQWFPYTSQWRNWDRNTLEEARCHVIDTIANNTDDIHPDFANICRFFVEEAIIREGSCSGLHLCFEVPMHIRSEAADSVTNSASKSPEHPHIAVCLLKSISNLKERSYTISQLALPNNPTQDLDSPPDAWSPPAVVLVRVKPCSESDCDVILMPPHIKTRGHLEYKLVALIFEGSGWTYHAHVLVDEGVWVYSSANGGNPEVHYDHVRVDNALYWNVNNEKPDSTHLHALVYVRAS